MTVDDIFRAAPAKTVLSPMAGYTDVGFRSVARSFGVGLTVTEMVSSKAIVMKNKHTEPLLMREDNDVPSAVQIFGHEPDVMAESVTIPQIRRFDAVDINMGCPVRKIVSNKEGSALMGNPRLASEIISSVKKAFGKTVSVKFRLGISDSGGAVDFARMCADSGADMITVHFRTARQMYAGCADYSLLPDIVKGCSVPVFANGDVKSREDYIRLTEMGAYGVAVGRGALGKPYVFAEIAGIPYRFDVLSAIRKHTEILLRYQSERVTVNEMKKHVAAYLKGMKNSRPVIAAAENAKSADEILFLVGEFVGSKNADVR